MLLKKIHAQPDAPLAKQVLGKLGFEVGFYFSSGVWEVNRSTFNL